MSAVHTDQTAEMASRVEELVARFREIGDTQMRDLPLYNERIEVEAVGFEPFGEGWIGVLVTPWFMNLVILPRDKIAMDLNAMGRQQPERLPAGETAFMWGGDEVTGMFKALSLHSPMNVFVVQAQARAEAQQQLAKHLAPPAEEKESKTPETPGRHVSRRALLRGQTG